MNKNVDVLAVMDDAAGILLDERMGAIASLLEVARAEVAELIEAAERLVDSANPETQGWSEAVDALARAKGA